MEFGKLLKKVRMEHQDSLKTLEQKTGIYYTFINKVESGTRPPSENFLEQIIKVYPSYKNDFINSYCLEKLPKIALKHLENRENLFDDMFSIIKSMDTEQQKRILNRVTDEIELLLYQNNKNDKETETLLKILRNKINIL